MKPGRTPQDLGHWTRLVGAARRAAAAPGRVDLAMALERAGRRAAKAVFPAPPFSRENPHYRLLRLATAWAGSPPAERSAGAADLKAMVTAAEAHVPLLARPPSDPDPPPPRRFRADIDG